MSEFCPACFNYEKSRDSLAPRSDSEQHYKEHEAERVQARLAEYHSKEQKT